MLQSNKGKVSKLLIATRGEIAGRILRSTKLANIKAASLFDESDDPFQPHLKMAPIVSRNFILKKLLSYKNYETLAIPPIYGSAELVIRGALLSGCDSIHPGYGFLSEVPELKQLCDKHGITFIGPDLETLKVMSDKKLSIDVARAEGIPTFKGASFTFSSRYTKDEQFQRDIAKAKQHFKHIGFPIILKLSNSGGGKGMSIANNENELHEYLQTCYTTSNLNEPECGFTIVAEQYLPRSRHIEVQLAGDGQNVVPISMRECTLQRNFQKVVEESGEHITTIDNILKTEATKFGTKLKLRGLATVEFLVSKENENKHFFIEANPRIQVEHGVSEQVTKVDYVILQLLLAKHYRLEDALRLSQEAYHRKHLLNFRKSPITPKGFSVEARIYSESPINHFIPTQGKISLLRLPNDIRADVGIAKGSTVSVNYDPLLVKLISFDKNRNKAIEKLKQGLNRTIILGPETNIPFLKALLNTENVQKRDYYTNWIQRDFIPEYERQAKLLSQTRSNTINGAISLAFAKLFRSKPTTNFFRPTTNAKFARHFIFDTEKGLPVKVRLEHGNKWTATVNYMDKTETKAVSLIKFQIPEDGDDTTKDILISTGTDATPFRALITIDEQKNTVLVSENSIRMTFTEKVHNAVTKQMTNNNDQQESPSETNAINAPFPGKVIKLFHKTGDIVQKGERVCLIEAMKMQHPIVATKTGKLRVAVSERQNVSDNEPLAFID